jgi:hypothetical protein
MFSVIFWELFYVSAVGCEIKQGDASSTLLLVLPCSVIYS